MMTSFSRALLVGSSLSLLASVAPAAALTLEPISSFKTHVFDEGAAEIVSYDKAGKTIYVVNGNDKAIDILDVKDPTAITKVGELNVTDFGKGANSVDVHGDYVAIAVENEDKQAPGKLVLYKTDGSLVGDVTLGALPDCVVFAPDGSFVMVANEGEPSDDFKTDPEGTVSIVAIPSLEVKTIGFSDLKAEDFGDDFHTAAPRGSSFAQQIEPEYVAITPDSKTAFVSLQESNAIAVIDTETASLKKVFSLGFQDYSKVKADMSDKDGTINRQNWPVLSFRMPDTVKAFSKDGVNYVVMSNEGDSRDYDGYSEEARLADVTLDPTAFPNAKELQKKENLGRLKITTSQGDTDGDGDFDVIYGYGGRSFSIFNEDGEMVFDSADEIEAKLAELAPSAFNSEGADESFDSRSDDKGAEPEALELAEIDGKRYAFVGLERMSGIMVYDITDPANASYVTYASNAKLDGEAEKMTAGDLAPEGIKFIAGEDSPNGAPMLAVANEVSGTTTLWAIK